MKKFRNCQSCGMPLKRDPEGGGTNLDGSKNLMYCSYCYHHGEFTQPDIGVSEMKASCKTKMVEQGFPGFLARIFVSGIPKLHRWKNR